MMTPLQPKSFLQLQCWFSKVTGTLLIFCCLQRCQPEVISVITPVSEALLPVAVALQGSCKSPLSVGSAQHLTDPSPVVS